ncbi:torsin-1A-interacting protein 1 isoform X2 [Sorex fumeus]|uniref:torsin-1A-interacting protein 1 isoform X2 n=1 Tax=Sorex fumeus TaxID=62283 RepID=UPI0024AD2082|nr:torsin-1A-interacting protein 1 isoform X2 [Sorex fumeus]
MAGEGRWAGPGPEARGEVRVATPRPPLRRAAAQPGAGSDALPAAPASPAPRPARREVRFSDAPPEVYGDDDEPPGGGGDWLPGGTRSPREEFRAEAAPEPVPESTYYLRSLRSPPRPPEPAEMTTRRVTRRQQQQPLTSAPARRGLRDSRFSDEDEPSPQRALSPRGTRKSMRSPKEVPVLIDDPISELRRPPLRSPRLGSPFKPNGNSNPSELGDEEEEEEEEAEEEEEEPESSDSEASSPQLRSREALESADPIPRSSHYADRQSSQYQDFTTRDHQPSGLSSGYPKVSQEWNERIGGIRSRRPISSGSKSSVPGGFSDDDSLRKPELRNQRPPSAAQQAPRPPKAPSSPPKESSWPGPCSWPLLLLLAVVAGVALYLMGPSGSPAADSPDVQVFQSQMQQLRQRYRGQDEKLWRRSAALLEKHLNGSRPRPQPAILLLAAARDAEDVLHCLGEHIADAYAASLDHRAPAIRIDGAGLASRDSGAAKLQVDEALSRGFEGGRAAAVVHRFESLPAGATLIFYKYCDHEHAAFKDVALVLTVLLEDKTLGASPDLKHVEEKVRDFLRVKFIEVGAPSGHDRMDADKLSGLWSRISHLVLPVQPERSQKRGSCL